MAKTIGQLLDDPDEFFFWLNTAWTSIAVLNAAIESGMLDALGDEPVALEELAGRLGLPSDKLARMVNFLAAHGLVELTGDGGVVQTPAMDRLRDAATSVQNTMISTLAGSVLYPALRQGVTPFEMRFGKPVFEHFTDNPELATRFADFMGFMTRRIERFLFSRHEFKPFATAVDVGGSHGGLLLRLLAEHPEARGILFDLPHVAAQVAAAVRAAPQGDRVEVIGGSFFEAVPAADLYLLKMILHDWDDEECVAILRNIRKAIPPGGRIAVIDHLLPERPEPTEGLGIDLAMLVWDTGRERKLSEFEALFDASGFRLDRVTENPHRQSVMEAVPV